MASLGHIAVGAAAARTQRGAEWRWPTLLFWSALSMLPDADVIAFAFGIPYEAPWGHRGATHSFVFAAVVGVLVGMCAPLVRWPVIKTGAAAALVVASHALLDTLTDGGLGCALLWPLDNTRYFAPWRPIPVAPLGLAFFSPYGFFVSVVEIILFAPLLLYVWWPRRRLWLLSPVWIAVVWLIGSTDPVRDGLIGRVVGDDTEYSNGYSDRGFRQIARGDGAERVRQLVGDPFGEWWDYNVSDANPCPFVYIENGVVSSRDLLDVCIRHGITSGVSEDVVLQKLGKPYGECWSYTRSRSGRSFRARTVCLWGGEVEEVLWRWAISRP